MDRETDEVYASYRLQFYVYLDYDLLYFFGVMDKFHAKNRCSPYAARLYARSKPLNTKNAFFAAQNRSGKMAPKVANNATDACPVTSVSAVGKS